MGARKGITRRQFLAAGVAIPTVLRASSRPRRAERVAIVGAGIAGLAAAQRLKQAQFDPVVIEGRGRIGGRVLTSTNLGVPIDLGASWLLGTESNPLYDIVQAEKFKTFESSLDSLALYTAGSERVSAAEYSTIEQLYDNWRDYALDKAPEAEPKLPLSAALRDWSLNRQLQPRELLLLNWFMSREFEFKTGGNLSQISYRLFNRGTDLLGQHLILPQGMRQICLKLTTGIKVELETRVSLVSLEPDGVTLTSVHGDKASKRFFDRVIVAIPLGRLAISPRSYCPGANDEKIEALKRLKMGTLSKIAMRFPKVFWPEGVHLVSFASPARGDILQHWSYSKVTDAPILVTAAVGDTARKLEKMKTAAECVDLVMENLKSLFGSDIPKPEVYEVARWGSDYWSQGSVPFFAAGCNGDEIELVRAPLQDFVFYAGDHCDEQFFGTAHGAYRSGVAAAERIIKLSGSA